MDEESRRRKDCEANNEREMENEEDQGGASCLACDCVYCFNCGEAVGREGRDPVG